MTLYISGKITGDKNYKRKFKRAKSRLLKRGYDVVSPTDIGEYSFLTYEQFLHIDFALIDVCDGIYMLKDWQDSNGARLEHNYAKSKDKEILYEPV